MNLKDRLRQAGTYKRLKEQKKISSCIFRGEKVGQRDCLTCKGKVKYIEYECMKNDSPIILSDCKNCKDQSRPIVAPPILNLDLAMSNRCNLRCDFCFVFSKHAVEYEPSYDKLMDSIDWFFGQNKKIDKNTRRLFTVYGGEPLLEWEVLKKVIVKTRELYGEYKHQFLIVTNGVLLDEEKIKWLMEHHCDMQISIDGCPVAHDTHRRFANGNGCSTIVEQNAKKLMELRPNTPVRGTITPETVHMLYESAMYLIGLGFKTVNLVPAGGIIWNEESLIVLEDQIMKLAEFQVQNTFKGEFINMFIFKKGAESMFKPQRESWGCGAGRSMVAIDNSGNIWPCHRFLGEDSNLPWCLGNIYKDGNTNTNFYDLLVSGDTRLAEMPDCKKCTSRLSCQSHCCHEIWELGPNYTAGIPNGVSEWQRCRIIKIYSAAYQYVYNKTMASGNNFFAKKLSNLLNKNKAKKSNGSKK